MFKKHFLYYLAVFLISLFADWIIQLTYYLYKTAANPDAFDGLRTLFDYNSGKIGDFILLPITNVLILYLILSLNLKIPKADFKKIIALGFLGDILLHFVQGILNLTNWSMPEPFHWSFVGLNHMVTFFFQWTYLVVFFYLVIKRFDQIKRQNSLVLATIFAFALLLIFMVLFLHDYHWFVNI